MQITQTVRVTNAKGKVMEVAFSKTASGRLIVCRVQKAVTPMKWAILWEKAVPGHPEEVWTDEVADAINRAHSKVGV